MTNSTGLNNFTKLEKIGEGSFGEVFKAIDEETNEIYAVKIFRNEFIMNSREYLNSLSIEVTLLSKLKHPTILPFIKFSYFSFDDEQRPAIVTKYAVNGSLAQIMQIGRQYPIFPFLDNTKILCIIYGIASAISYSHSKNTVHLDLKPANILLDEFLFPLVCDFGLAKILNNGQHSFSLTTSTNVRGTPIYIAPEFWKYGKYSTSCDVYSFALVLYSIFTFEEPFANYNQYQFFTSVIQNGERPDLNSKIPDPFKKLIIKCWTENPSERPDFNYILKDLETNSEYIIDGVDKEKYFKYIMLIKEYQNNFDSKEEKTQFLNALNSNFVKVNIKNEIEKEPELGIAFESLFDDAIKELKKLPLKKQVTIENIIFNENKKTNFYKIQINSDQIKELYNEEMLDSPYFMNILKFFTNILFEVQFPTKDYYSIMNILKLVKDKYIKRIRITNIVLNVNAIGNEFKNNTLINNVMINPPVSFIAKEAFRGCINLKKITIPQTVTAIEDSTFSMCEKLENVTILGNIQKIGVNAFRGAHKIKCIHIPSSVVEIGKSCFRGDNSLESIILPANLISINKSVFKGCVLLREVTIHSHVKVIESSAFEECVKLSKIVIPPSVEIIKDNAFKCCVALKSISFDPVQTKIEKNAFYDCSNLHILFITTSQSSFYMNMEPFNHVNEIVIPKNVTSIQNPLPGITISDAVLNIGNNEINMVPFSNDSFGRLGVDSQINY